MGGVGGYGREYGMSCLVLFDTEASQVVVMTVGDVLDLICEQVVFGQKILRAVLESSFQS